MKDILERAGFEYKGFCKTCDGQAELYQKNGVQCKIRVRQMRFELQVGNNKIKGKSQDLEMTLQRYLVHA